MKWGLNGVLGIIYHESDQDFLLIEREGEVNFLSGTRNRRRDQTTIDTLERELSKLGLKPREYSIKNTSLTQDLKKENDKLLVFLVKTSKKELKPQNTNILIHGWFQPDEVLNELTIKGLKDSFKKALKLLRNA